MEKKIDMTRLRWVKRPRLSVSTPDKLIVETEPFSDLKKDGTCIEAIMPVEGKTFCLSARCDFNYKNALDQCGLVLYEEDQRKAVVGMEYHDGELSELASNVYHSDGYDRCHRDLASGICWMYYRIWVREDTVLVEYSFNGKRYSGMRRFRINRDHQFHVGIFACSPLDSSFDCIFSEMKVMKEEETENEY